MRVTTRQIYAAALMALVVVSGAGRVEAQQAASGGAVEKATPSTVSLKVTVNISRFDGEKRTANLPFVLWVNAGGKPGQIRMGIDVPVPQITFKADGGGTTQSYTYRTVGTNIDCSATDLGNDRYRLDLGITDSQVFSSESVLKSVNDMARFQNFTANNQPILRDGQTVQYAVATDKISGEVIKLDVTLNVVK